MNTDQLYYLIDLAKTSSINTTARRCFSSHQAVSDAIRKLEEELNCTLLYRSKKGVSLTEDGKQVLLTATEMMEQYQMLIDKYQSNNTPPVLNGTMQIGVAPLIADTLLSELLLQMYQKHPEISLCVQEYPADMLLSMLRDGMLDVCLVAFNPIGPVQLEDIDRNQYSSIESKRLYVDKMVCVMSSNNPLSAEAIITDDMAAEGKNTTYLYKDELDFAFLKNDGTQNRYLHISNNAELHQTFMREEGTICAMPYQVYKAHYDKKGYVSRPMETVPSVENYMLWKKPENKNQEALYDSFLQTIMSVVEKYVL